RVGAAAGNDPAPDRRPYGRAAGSARLDTPRLGGAGLRCHASLREHAERHAVSRRAQCRRHARGLSHPGAARRFARPYRAGARSAGDAALSGSIEGARHHRRAARRSSRGAGQMSPPGKEAPSRALAAFAAGWPGEGIAPSALHEARRSLVNFFGCALGASADPDIDRLARLLAQVAGRGRAAVIGRAERLDPLNAALVNAAAGNLFDFDDTHPETILHPTAPVAPALLALAALRRVSGLALLQALVIGVEVECRLANAVSPGHYRRG